MLIQMLTLSMRLLGVGMPELLVILTFILFMLLPVIWLVTTLNSIKKDSRQIKEMLSRLLTSGRSQL